MNSKWIVWAAVLGATAIMLGAFGAHGLKKILTPEQLVTFEVGVRYQMYHALFLLGAGAVNFLSNAAKKWILLLTLFGVLFFSGSIYLLSTGLASGFSKWLGPVTPIGGLMLISAWLILLFQALKPKAEKY